MLESPVQVKAATEGSMCLYSIYFGRERSQYIYIYIYIYIYVYIYIYIYIYTYIYIYIYMYVCICRQNGTAVDPPAGGWSYLCVEDVGCSI